MTDIIERNLPGRFAVARPARPGRALHFRDFQPLWIGPAALNLARIVAEAYALAYAAPFGLRHVHPQWSGETADEGRDPDW